MTSLLSKKKARRIVVDEGDPVDADSGKLDLTSRWELACGHRRLMRCKYGKEADVLTEATGSTVSKDAKIAHRPLKQSSLRKSTTTADLNGDSDSDSGNVVIRATKAKKKARPPPSSKLSFGTAAADDDGDAADEGGVVRPKAKPAKASISRLAFRATFATDSDTDRPRYSAEVLAELQSSTPNAPPPPPLPNETPPPLSDDAMELDASELDGATVVTLPDDGSGKALSSAQAASLLHQTQILSDAQIRERKERRARLAAEQRAMGSSGDGEDFIPLGGGSDESDDSFAGHYRRRLGQLSRVGDLENPYDEDKMDVDTRLVPDDEDFAEGFEAFTEDGGIALGRKAEREARERRRKEMRELISSAEHGGGGPGVDADDDASSDSEAERRIEFERAQARAGLDGVRDKPVLKDARGKDVLVDQQVPIPNTSAPLPNLAVSLEAFTARVASIEAALQARRKAAADLDEEVAENEARRREVQNLLDQRATEFEARLRGEAVVRASGEDTDGAKGGEDGKNGADVTSGSGTPVGLTGFDHRAALHMDRGLESIGGTPTARPWESVSATPSLSRPPWKDGEDEEDDYY